MGRRSVITSYSIHYTKLYDSEEYLTPGSGIASLSSSGMDDRNHAELSKEEKAALEAGLRDVFFAYDQWTLSETGMEVLDHDAKWLKEHPGAVLKVVITSYSIHYTKLYDELPPWLPQHERQLPVDPDFRIVIDGNFKNDRRAGWVERADLVWDFNVRAIPIKAETSGRPPLF